MRFHPNTRQFENIREHDEEIIKRWNEKIGERDEVYHLGDFSFGSPNYTKDIFKRLNGKKHLIIGNHDRRFMKELYPELFLSTQYYLRQTIQVDGKKQDIILSHYAFRVWEKSHFGSWHLFGHSHGRLPMFGLSMDVGVDTNELRPYHLHEIQDIMAKEKERLEEAKVENE